MRILPFAAALLLAGPLVAASPPNAAAFLQQAEELPALDAAGKMLPLTRQQLTAQEAATFAKLRRGGVAARQFLYVRGFLRYCRRVALDRSIPPLQLPPMPSRSDWNRDFLSKDEKDIVDVALGMVIYARMNPSPPQPSP